MSIVTQTMLESRVGEAELIRLTDDGATGSLDTGVMNHFIDAGEGELLGLIGQRYVLPLALTNTSTAETVQNKCLDVVVYRLYVHRDRGATPDLADLYRAAIKWAEGIALGKFGLLDETAVSESPAGGGRIIAQTTDRVIDRDSMKGL